jgi:hypothetical protein
MATNYTERKWEAQLEWSQVYRQEPRRLEKICRQPVSLMDIIIIIIIYGCVLQVVSSFPVILLNLCVCF